MKILVLGAAGMFGHVVSMYFKERGHDVVAYARRPVFWCESIIGDANDTSALASIISAGEYDAIINAIGLLNRSADDNLAISVLTNSYLPHFLASLTKDMLTRIIHMSTDCVFSGAAGGYKENSTPDGATFYDRTKALGELNDKKNLTFRTSIIGPDINEAGIGLFHWFMQQRGPINGYLGAIWTGVSTITLAQAMEKALDEGLTGLYHLVNNETINKYDLLCLFNKHFRNGSVEIRPFDSDRVDKSLVNTRTDFSFIVPPYSQMVEDMKKWVDEHKDIYPIYAK